MCSTRLMMIFFIAQSSAQCFVAGQSHQLKDFFVEMLFFEMAMDAGFQRQVARHYMARYRDSVHGWLELVA